MITIVGIGPGDPGLLFATSKRLLDVADYVIGSKRQLASVNVSQKKQIILPKDLNQLEQFLHEHLETSLVLLASGDPLTYGIGSWFKDRFASDQIQIIPGISSIHYLFSKAQLSMADCFLTSSHGRDPDFDRLLSLPKVGMVTDQRIGPYQIAQEILRRGAKKKLLIGEALSYPEERLRWFLPDEVPDEEYLMNVVVILDER